MKFPQALIAGRLVRRYKRFLADIELDSGEIITAHTANSGSMLGLTEPGNPVFLSYHDKPGRKLKYSWEIVEVDGVKVGINTHLPNRLVEEAIGSGVLQELQGYRTLAREKKYGQNSRIDLLLSDPARPECYVEVKNVTLVEGSAALFPDAVTARGQKHLLELTQMVAEGHRAVMCFVLQRSDGQWFAPADAIDPEYGRLLRQAMQAGVEALVYRAKVSPSEICLTEPVAMQVGALDENDLFANGTDHRRRK